MKLHPLAALSLPLMMMPAMASAAEPAKLDTDAKKAAYSIGFRIGSDVLRNFPDVDGASLHQGLADALKKAAPALTPEQQQEVLMKWQTASAQAALTRNTEASKKFLAENAKKPGVVTLPSGLQYQVLESGKGASPAKSDQVKVHYHGTLVNGQVFDSSVQRGEPASFRVDQVIPGWTEALQKMKAGDKWKLFIPPQLAYGDRGAGQVIGPGSALIFEVQLLEVLPAGKGK